MQKKVKKMVVNRIGPDSTRPDPTRLTNICKYRDPTRSNPTTI